VKQKEDTYEEANMEYTSRLERNTAKNLLKLVM